MTTFSYVKSSIKKYSVSRNAFLPRFVTVPLVQEKDVQCKPVVKIGNFVSEGQVIAVPQGVTDCKIHSPVPGEVTDIFTDVSASGRPELMIKIKLAGSFSFTGKKQEEIDWKNLSPQTVCGKMAENGVVNTFRVSDPVSLATQISDSRAQALVVRMFDEDPVRLTDTFVSTKFFNEVRKGAEITAYAAKISNILFIVDSAFENKSQDVTPSEKLFYVNSKKYPSGFRKEICSAYNKANKKADIQLSEEDLFVDSSTMYEVYKAVGLGIPPVERLVQFTGNCIPVNCVLNVRLGTTMDDLVKQIGGFTRKPNIIIVNGHVTGNSSSCRNIPVTKYVKSISFVSEGRTPEQLSYPCIDCGNCRDICPRNLAPDLLYRYKIESLPLPEKYISSAAGCAECGLCNSVCPSRLPLSQVITVLKKQMGAE